MFLVKFFILAHFHTQGSTDMVKMKLRLQKCIGGITGIEWPTIWVPRSEGVAFVAMHQPQYP